MYDAFFQKIMQKYSDYLANIKRSPNVLEEGVERAQNNVDIYKNLYSAYKNVLNSKNNFYA